VSLVASLKVFSFTNSSHISLHKNLTIKVPAFAALVRPGMEAKRPRLAFSLQKKQALSEQKYLPFLFHVGAKPIRNSRDFFFFSAEV